MSERTVVHLLRHGEVHNPDKILYGRIAGFRLSDNGRDQADIVAKALAEEDAAAGTIVLADGQMAGRGLAGRRWHSPKGEGLYLSLIFRPRAATSPLLVPVTNCDTYSPPVASAEAAQLTVSIRSGIGVGTSGVKRCMFTGQPM